MIYVHQLFIINICLEINSKFSNVSKLSAFIDLLHGLPAWIYCSRTCNVYVRLIGPMAILIKNRCNFDLEIFVFFFKKLIVGTKLCLSLLYD